MKPPKYNGKITKYYENRLRDYLFSNIKKTSPENEKIIKKAYKVAFNAHYHQRRKDANKEPYITHPVEVAIIASKEMGFGSTTVIGALLHDVVEDSPDYDLQYIETEFGKTIALLVKGVTKITRISGKDSSEQMDTFIKIIMTIPQDYRVFIIKTADRLHNMRTMDNMPENTRRIKSSENLFIYSKIAEAMGLWNIKRELENSSFRYMHADKYFKIKELQKKFDPETKKRLNLFQKEIQKILEKNYNNFEITTIERSLYRVWQKMEKHNLYYQDVHNHFSTRIILDIPGKMERGIAYPIYWAITNFFTEKKGSSKDWIMTPKKNGFSALVFSVIFNGHLHEVQILSKDDNEIANHGFLKKDVKITPGLKNLEENIKSYIYGTKDAGVNLINKIQDITNTEQIFVYSPKGQLYEMPKGSTILDFAFKIHTGLGKRCLGAKINNNQAVRAPGCVINTTDIIEILSSKKECVKKEWLEFVTTSKAKKSIINYLKKNEIPLPNLENKTYKVNRKKPFTIDDSVDYIPARCCNPIIGDEAMVFLNKNNHLIVHKETCKKVIDLRAKYSNRTATVIWRRINRHNAILTTITLEGEDRMGILKDIIDIISNDLKINIKKISVENFDGFFKGEIDLYIRDLEHLNETISKIKNLEHNIKVKRK